MGKVRLNEDCEIVARVREGLKRKEGYCPCRLEVKPEYKCICDEFKAQIQDPDFENRRTLLEVETVYTDSCGPCPRGL